MPSHTTLIVIIVTKENTNLLAHGFAKYQLADNDFKIIRWKYFYPFNKPQVEFSIGDIVIHITSDFVIFEVMDIDFMTSNVNVVQDVQLSITSNISKRHSDIDMIAEDTDSNIPQAVKRPHRLTSKPLKQSSSLSAINNEFAAPSQDPGPSTNIDRRVRVKDAPEDDDEFEILEECVIEVSKKNKGRKA
ncbi:hypothetical protein C2G38_2196135 [Gigaspora rosea]|uniref:Uncharacterized protein n=1 Tax=Gigaspora rosea TaxID=44941 RepID=A0A397UWA0_9GLOM|nr:hypothetical protein C2G38_2196135 [Gigaspora rosea]